MQTKRRAADPERQAALTKDREELSLNHAIRNMKQVLEKQNPEYEFYFKNGCIQYKKK